jgi:hypothetical protein
MHRYIHAGSAARILLAITAVVLCIALSAAAQTPGTVQYNTQYSASTIT